MQAKALPRSQFLSYQLRTGMEAMTAVMFAKGDETQWVHSFLRTAVISEAISSSER